MMYRFNDINYFDFAKEIDVASWDNYPTWHKPTETIEETALDTAMMHDLYYSLKGKPFLMMESSPSFTNCQQAEAPRYRRAVCPAGCGPWVGQRLLLPVAC